MKKIFVLIILIMQLLAIGCENSLHSDRKANNRKLLYCIGSSVRLRKSPDLKSKIIGNIKEGDRVEVLDQSKHRTTITMRMGYDKVKKIKEKWLKVRLFDNKVGWTFGGYFFKRYFKEPDKKLDNVPYTTSAYDNGKIKYHAPWIYPIGCSKEGHIAYMYFPTENPACGSSYVEIYDTRKRKKVYVAHFCSLDGNVWHAYKNEINRKLNEYNIQSGHFTLSRKAIDRGQKKIKISLVRKGSSFNIKGCTLYRSTDNKKKKIADVRFKDSVMQVKYGGWFKNRCTGKAILMIIKIEVGESFDFYELSL